MTALWRFWKGEFSHELHEILMVSMEFKAHHGHTKNATHTHTLELPNQREKKDRSKLPSQLKVRQLCLWVYLFKPKRKTVFVCRIFLCFFVLLLDFCFLLHNVIFLSTCALSIIEYIIIALALGDVILYSMVDCGYTWAHPTS